MKMECSNKQQASCRLTCHHFPFPVVVLQHMCFSSLLLSYQQYGLPLCQLERIQAKALSVICPLALALILRLLSLHAQSGKSHAARTLAEAADTLNVLPTWTRFVLCSANGLLQDDLTLSKMAPGACHISLVTISTFSAHISYPNWPRPDPSQHA